MKEYTIEFTKRAKASLKLLEKKEQARVIGAIEFLKTDPVPPKAKRLSGTANYRIRVGNLRIIYSVSGRRLLILVLELDIGKKSTEGISC